MNSAVSVVIPCHNSARWLAGAITSALTQEGVSPRVIVVDDSSTDASREIAASYGSKVLLLEGQWKNGNSARNAGLARVETEWVQFLDADDELSPGKLAGQLQATTPERDIIYSALIVRNESSGEESLAKPTPDSDLVEQWLHWELFQTGAGIWRTAALRQIGGWKEGLPCCQDNELVLRALQAGLKFLYVDSPGAVYRIWSEETVCRKDPRKVVIQKTALIERCLEWLADRSELSPALKRAAGQAFFEMARTLAKYDLREASAYFKSKSRLGLITIDGAAATRSFRIVQRLSGFAMAERIAKQARRCRL